MESCARVPCMSGFAAGELTVSRALGDFHLEQLKFRDDGGSFAGPLTAEPEVHAQDQGLGFKSLCFIQLQPSP